MLGTEPLLSRIVINPKIMLGKPTIRGMRFTRQTCRRRKVLRVEVKAFSIQWNGRPAILHFIKNTAEKTLPETDSPQVFPGPNRFKKHVNSL